MTCIKCRLRSLYYRLYRRLLLPIRSIAGGIYLEDQVTATLIKDGKIIRRIVGPKIHNRWHGGMEQVASGLRVGCSGNGDATKGLRMKHMRLGSGCSEAIFTYIDATEAVTTNSNPAGDYNVKFTSIWDAPGAINNICQAQLRINIYTGTSETEAAIYNFGTQFDKPDGISLHIEWTTTLSSP